MVDLENEAGGNWNTDFLGEYFYVYFMRRSFFMNVC
jgi:hypothetical protein